MEIYIVRHGETDWNLQRRLQGREDIPMNGTGVAQANAAGQALAGIEFEYILSSPLIRARLTAEIIDGYVRCGKVVCEEGLTERCFGSLSGQQVKNLYTAECDDMEPWEEVDRRVREVLDRYAARGCTRVLAVSHGGTIRSLFRGIMGDSTPSPMILKNACISVCELTGEGIAIRRYNMSADEFAGYRAETQGDTL